MGVFDEAREAKDQFDASYSKGMSEDANKELRVIEEFLNLIRSEPEFSRHGIRVLGTHLKSRRAAGFLEWNSSYCLVTTDKISVRWYDDPYPYQKKKEINYGDRAICMNYKPHESPSSLSPKAEFVDSSGVFFRSPQDAAKELARRLISENSASGPGRDMFVDLSSTRFVDFEYDSVCEILEKKFEISYKQIERAEKQKQKQKEMFAQMRNFVIFFAIALIAGKILRSFFV